MPFNPDKAVLRARKVSLRLKRDFEKRWGEFSSTMPTGMAPPQQQQQQPFNQAENPAQGGISAEGRTPGASDRVTTTGQDSFQQDA